MMPYSPRTAISSAIPANTPSSVTTNRRGASDSETMSDIVRICETACVGSTDCTAVRIALVSPAPAGALNGNISFDAMHNPVSVNLGFFNVCDPNDIAEYAENCQIDNFTGTCPNPPNPYCPQGTNELIGTGFDIWNPGENGIAAGATSWLTSQAPVKGGETITIRFAMWDTGDQNFDSTTLIDNFQWIADGSSVTVVTTPIMQPQ